jgi:hypothetical protein
MKWLKAGSSKLTPTIRVKPPCGVYLDACEGKLWQSLPDGKLALLGKADLRVVAALMAPLVKASSVAPTPDLISFAEAAQRAGLARKTLYEWKRTGKLRREHGLRMLGRSPRIEWPVFKACIDNGGLS